MNLDALVSFLQACNEDCSSKTGLMRTLKTACRVVLEVDQARSTYLLEADPPTYKPLNIVYLYVDILTYWF